MSNKCYLCERCENRFSVHCNTCSLPVGNDEGSMKPTHYMDSEDKVVHATGIKFDDAKSELDYLDQYFPNALNGVQAVSKFGAEKYGWNTWQNVSILRYKHALRRHQLALASGEDIDPESGKHHCYHIAWNAMAIAELTTRKAIEAE